MKPKLIILEILVTIRVAGRMSFFPPRQMRGGSSAVHGKGGDEVEGSEEEVDV